MLTSDVAFRADGIEVVPITNAEGKTFIEVEVEGAQLDGILDNLDLSEIADYYGKELVEYMIENYNLQEAE